MKPDSLIELLEERPFVPLVLHLSDGRNHEVRHPEMAIVSDDIVAIGLPRAESVQISEQITYCATAHIVEVTPNSDPSSRSN